MASLTKFIVLAAAVLSASAAPTAPTSYTTEADVDSQQSGAQCGNGQKLSCCNSGNSLLGLNCLSVPIRKLPSFSLRPTLDDFQGSFFFLLTQPWYSRRANPAVLRFQRCRLLSDWRLHGMSHLLTPKLCGGLVIDTDANESSGKPHQHRAQLPYHWMIVALDFRRDGLSKLDYRLFLFFSSVRLMPFYEYVMGGFVCSYPLDYVCTIFESI